MNLYVNKTRVEGSIIKCDFSISETHYGTIELIFDDLVTYLEFNGYTSLMMKHTCVQSPDPDVDFTEHLLDSESLVRECNEQGILEEFIKYELAVKDED